MGRKKADSRHSKPATLRSALASRIADKWAGAAERVALDRMISELGDVPRYDIVAALKELEKSGAGEFVVGQAGRKSCFIWRASAASSQLRRRAAPGQREAAVKASVRAEQDAARGGSGQPDSAPVGQSAPAPTLDHVFHLRPGFMATLRLPQDVTQTEIERFCHFLRAIPFARPADVAELRGPATGP